MVEAEVSEPEGCYVLFRGRLPRVSVKQIMEEMCKHRGHTLDELIAPGRLSYVARSRQLVMWLADRLRPDLSFLTVAKMLGRHDHTTVIWGVKRIERLVASGCPHTILALTEMCRRLGIETIDMARPSSVRLTPVALEERARRKVKEDKWITPQSMLG